MFDLLDAAVDVYGRTTPLLRVEEVSDFDDTVIRVFLATHEEALGLVNSNSSDGFSHRLAG